MDEKDLDPGTLMHLKVVTATHKISSYQVFHSFYEEMRSNFSIFAKAKNLFLLLTESIAHTLNVTLCYVCGEPTWEKKLVHVPDQTWGRWTPSDLFGGWFSALGVSKP
jgi:hypothetical protein